MAAKHRADAASARSPATSDQRPGRIGVPQISGGAAGDSQSRRRPAATRSGTAMSMPPTPSPRARRWRTKRSVPRHQQGSRGFRRPGRPVQRRPARRSQRCGIRALNLHARDRAWGRCCFRWGPPGATRRVVEVHADVAGAGAWLAARAPASSANTKHVGPLPVGREVVYTITMAGPPRPDRPAVASLRDDFEEAGATPGARCSPNASRGRPPRRHLADSQGTRLDYEAICLE